jgi:glutamate-ammonia-ligase adenylyltransferase
LPVLLGWFGDDFDPDRGLLAFRRLSDELGTAHWFLKLLRDSGTAAHSLVHLLGNSRFLDDAVARSPETVQWLDAPNSLADDLAGDWLNRITKEAEALVSRAETPATAVAALRGLRRRELARIAGGEVLGLIDRSAAALALSKLVDLVLTLGLRVTVASVTSQRGLESAPTEMLIVAMGRLGGQELGYGSDGDVMFGHKPLPGSDERLASEFAIAVASQLRESLRAVSEEPPILIDADLRPEGKNGPMARSLESYREYYAKWSSPWEAQALLRARPLTESELAVKFQAIIDPLRYPTAGLSDTSLREIRRLKARMEAERLPRAVTPSRHLKLGPGGLSDVEWTAQLLQLQYGAKVPGLQTTSTLAALAAAQQAGLLTELDETTLSQAWVLASRLRSAVVLASGKATGSTMDLLPNNNRDLGGIAAVLAGYRGEGLDDQGPLGGQQIADDYLRSARHARKVMERIFYDAA